MHFCISRFSNDWAAQYYYDVDSDEIHIAVEESRREEARDCLREFSADVYKIVDPWQSSYHPGMDMEMGDQQTQMELYPGHNIRNTRNMKWFLFSGSVISHELGITVAHAIDPGDEIDIPLDSDDAAVANERIVGRCRASFGNLQRQDGTKLTADLALLELKTDRCLVGNKMWWPCRGSRPLRLKIYKDNSFPVNSRVLILYQNGKIKRGCIGRENLTDDTITTVNLRGGVHDVFSIYTSTKQEVPITQDGDSGALVMSVPNKKTDVVYVYGIVIGIYKTKEGKSSTIANSLWKVIHEISTNENYSAELVDGTQNIDFALHTNEQE